MTTAESSMPEQNGGQRSYPGFDGTVGETFAASEPSWLPRTVPPDGAPNVVVVLADNMGYSDIGPFGSEIETPQLDRLAAEGVRMSNFHTTPICSPSRAALLTGLNPHVAGVGQVLEGTRNDGVNGSDCGFPGYRGELADYAVTAGEVFRHNGYATLMVGKWHVTGDMAGEDLRGWPLQRGFDRFYGFMGGVINYHHPVQIVEDNHFLDIEQYPDGYYLTDDLTDKAIAMVREQKASNPARPFFMYFGHQAPHAPHQCKPEDLEKYKDAYDEGWDVSRARRFERQKELGIVDEDTTLPPPDTEPPEFAVKPWDELNEREKELFARYRACYAGMVDNIDQNFGRLRGALEELGEWENTIVVFLSDNGAECLGQQIGSNNIYRGVIRLLTGAGADETPFEQDYSQLENTGGPRTSPGFPTGWGMASNTPFRMWMTWSYNGAHTVPFILAGPGTRDEAGAIRHQYAFVTDLLPTLVELTGVTMPTHRHGVEVRPLDGVSFTEILRDSSAPPARREQYFECWGQRGYYRDGWTASGLHYRRTRFADDRWELHDVTVDPTQANDLSAEHPERLQELKDAFEQTAWDNQVYPFDEHLGLNQRTPADYPDPIAVTVRPGTPRLMNPSRLLAQRSFTIDADLAFDPSDQGVLAAVGTQAYGFVLFVENGCLEFEYNYYGQSILLHGGELPAGDHVVGLEAVAPGGNIWNLRLTVDGRQVVARDDVPMIVLSMGTITADVGLNRGSPVSWRIHEKYGVFRYSGTLRSVTITPGEQAPDRGPRLWEEIRQLALTLQ